MQNCFLRKGTAPSGPFLVTFQSLLSRESTGRRNQISQLLRRTVGRLRYWHWIYIKNSCLEFNSVLRTEPNQFNIISSKQECNKHQADLLLLLLSPNTNNWNVLIFSTNPLHFRLEKNIFRFNLELNNPLKPSGCAGLKNWPSLMSAVPGNGDALLIVNWITTMEVGRGGGYGGVMGVLSYTPLNVKHNLATVLSATPSISDILHNFGYSWSILNELDKGFEAGPEDMRRILWSISAPSFLKTKTLADPVSTANDVITKIMLPTSHLAPADHLDLKSTKPGPTTWYHQTYNAWSNVSLQACTIRTGSERNMEKLDKFSFWILKLCRKLLRVGNC